MLKFNKRTYKKILSLLLVIVISAGCITALMANATEYVTNPAPQILENDRLTISKTAERTGKNAFDITLSVTTKANEHAVRNPMRIILLADASWSTDTEGVKASVRDFAAAFFNQNIDGDQLGLVVFAEKAVTMSEIDETITSNLTNDINIINKAAKAKEKKTSPDIWATALDSTHGTYITNALTKAKEIFKSIPSTSGAQDFIIVISDGEATYANQITATVNCNGLSGSSHVMSTNPITVTGINNKKIGPGTDMTLWLNKPIITTCPCGITAEIEASTKMYAANPLTNGVGAAISDCGLPTILYAKYFIRNSDITIYSINVGAKNGDGKTVMDYITSNNKTNSSSAEDIKNTLFEIVNLATGNITIEPIPVSITDEMGENIIFDHSRLINSPAYEFADFDPQTKILSWSINKSQGTLNPDGTRTYTLTYGVTLDTDSIVNNIEDISTFDEDTMFPTNGTTTLGYKIEEETRTVNFDVPSVRGEYEHYSITYDKNDGTGNVPSDETQYLGGMSVTVANHGDLKKTGSHFAGWNTKADGSGTHYDELDSLAITKNTTLYAMWITAEKSSNVASDNCKPNERINYTIKVKVPENSSGIEITDELPEGVNYNNDANSNGMFEDNKITWQINNAVANTEYLLTFSVTVNDSVQYGDEITNSANISFKDNIYATNNVVDIVSEFFDVKYDANGGAGNVPTDSTYYSPDDVVIIKNQASINRDGYKFIGWNTKADGSGTHYDPNNVFRITENTTLYAMWFKSEKESTAEGGEFKPGEKIDYKITIVVPEDSNNITVTDEIPDGTIYNNDANSNGVFADGTLTWTIDTATAGTEYTLTFSVTIGPTAQADDEIINKASVNAYSTIYETNTVTDVVGEYFNVFYDANNGTGEVPSDTTNYSKNATVTVETENTLIRENYAFSGWNTKRDGSGTHYYANDTFIITENVTLYAMWTKVHKTSSMDNSCKPNEIINYNVNIIVPEDIATLVVTDSIPVGTTYNNDASLDGVYDENTITWTVNNATSGSEYNFGFSVTVSNTVQSGDEITNIADIRCDDQAYRTNITTDTVVDFYTVTYEPNGGVNDIPIDSNYYSNNDEVAIKEPGTLAKRNYQFAGWNTRADGSGTHYAPEDTFNITENTTLYAMWFSIHKESTVTNNTCKPGEKINYSIKFVAPENVSSIIVNDEIPEKTTYNSDANLNAIFSENIITWTINNAVAGTEYTLTFSVTIMNDIQPEDEITNIATVNIGDNSYDTNVTTDTVIEFFTVQYLPNGGTGATPVDLNYYTVNSPVVVKGINTLEKEGYQFSGWNTKTDGTGTHYDVNDVFNITNDTILHAMWLKAEKASAISNDCKPNERIDYSIDIVVPEDVANVTVTDSIPAGTVYNNDANLDGSVSDGEITWSFDNVTAGTEYTLTFSVTISDTVVFGDSITNTALVEIGDNSFSTNTTTDTVAKFFTVKYNANGARGVTPVDNTFYSDRANVTIKDKNTLSMNNHHFGGWNTKIDGTGTHYDPEDVLVIESDTTLYAMWIATEKDSVTTANGCKPGETINYSIKVMVPEDCNNVVITDSIPNGTVYNNDANTDGAFSDGIITWTIANATRGSEYILTFSVTITNSVSFRDEISNSATVTIGSNSYNTNTTVDSVIEFFTVQYLPNGGTGTAPEDDNYYTSNTSVTVKNGDALEKTDYQFIGWNTQADGNGTSYKANETFVINDNVVMYAMWLGTQKTSSIANNNCKPNERIDYSIDIVVPEDVANVTITDSIPAGTVYNDDANLDGSLSDGEITWSFDNVTAGTEYTLTFSVTISDTVVFGDSITNTALVEIGDNSFSTNTTTDAISRFFTVKYDANEADGLVPEDNTSYSEDTSVTVKDRNTLSKAGYYFEGWNTKADGTGTHYNPDNTFTIKSDTTLYAMWLKAKKSSVVSHNECKPNETIAYTISVTASENSDKLLVTDTIPDGTRYNNDANNGGTFEDNEITWTVNNAVANTEYVFTFTVTITPQAKFGDDITNTANVSINNNSYNTNTSTNAVIEYFTVKYHLNGGTGTVPIDYVYYSKAANVIVKSANSIEKENYTFIGWNTKLDGSGTHYNQGATFNINEDTDLYAMWQRFTKTSAAIDGEFKPGEKIRYSINVMIPENTRSIVITDTIPDGTTYNNDATPNGVYDNGKITWTINDVTAGSEYVVEFSVTISSSARFGSQIKNTATMTSNNISYVTNTVIDEIIEYFNISYDANGGTGDVPVDSNNYSPNVKVTTKNGDTLAKPGYQFTGWNTKADGSGNGYAVNDQFSITSNMKLYAMWLKANKQSVAANGEFKPGEKINYIIKVTVPENTASLRIVDNVPNGTKYNNDATQDGTCTDGVVEWVINDVTANTEYTLSFSVTINPDAQTGDEIKNTAKTYFNNIAYTTNTVTDSVGAFFNIKYNANGATGDTPVDNTNYSSNAEATIKDKNTLVKDNCHFAGWNTESDGSGTHYAPDATLNVTQDTELYAMWLTAKKRSTTTGSELKPSDIINYQINVLIPENVSNIVITDTIPEGTIYNNDASANCTYSDKKIEWTFNNLAAGTECVLSFSVTIMPTVIPGNTITNTAIIHVGNNRYTTNTVSDTITQFFKVNYNANGGSGTVPTDSDNYSNNSKVVVKSGSDLTRENYQFVGWNTQADGKGVHYNANESFNISSNTVLYAMWLGAQKQSTAITGGLKPGDKMQYSITVIAPETATSLVIKDQIPNHTSYNNDANLNGTLENNTITWTINNPVIGNEYVITFSVTIGTDFPTGESLFNTAVIKYRDLEYNTNTTSDIISYQLPGALTIENFVTGNIADTNRAFIFIISLDADGIFSYSGSKSGVIKNGDAIELKHGEHITIEGLPAGTAYHIQESNPEDYALSTINDTGEIMSEKTIVVTFNNEKSDAPATGDEYPVLPMLSMTVSILAIFFLYLTDDNRRKRKATT